MVSEEADAGGVMVGKVCLLGRESAGAKRGRRGVCEGILGLGPELNVGEKKGDAGLRALGESVDAT